MADAPLRFAIDPLARLIQRQTAAVLAIVGAPCRTTPRFADEPH
jgi:hypothetical protein